MREVRIGTFGLDLSRFLFSRGGLVLLQTKGSPRISLPLILDLLCLVYSFHASWPQSDAHEARGIFKPHGRRLEPTPCVLFSDLRPGLGQAFPCQARSWSRWTFGSYSSFGDALYCFVGVRTVHGANLQMDSFSKSLSH